MGAALGANGSYGSPASKKLLAALTEEVGRQVLRDSYLQTWAVSQEVLAKLRA